MSASNHTISVVHCAGTDACNFLHGQFTNDVKNLAIGAYQRNAYCNPKGRVLALFELLRISEEEFLLLLPEDLVSSVMKRLRMFVMRAKVTFEHLADRVVTPFSGNPGVERNHFSYSTSEYIVNSGLLRDRYLSIREGEPAPLPQAWVLEDIAEGLPRVFSSSSEEFLPQAINLDLVNALHLTQLLNLSPRSACGDQESDSSIYWNTWRWPTWRLSAGGRPALSK